MQLFPRTTGQLPLMIIVSLAQSYSKKLCWEWNILCSFSSDISPDRDDAVKYGPHFAIDGHNQSPTSAGGFYNTEQPPSSKQWLQIDMGSEYILYRVQIYFRSDNQVSTFADRRTNMEARVGDILASSNSTGNPLCERIISLPNAVQTILRCATPLAGQYIVIRRSDETTQWDVAEVHAYIWKKWTKNNHSLFGSSFQWWGSFKGSGLLFDRHVDLTGFFTIHLPWFLLVIDIWIFLIRFIFYIYIFY